MKYSLARKFTLFTAALCLAAMGSGCSSADKPSTAESSTESIVQESQTEAETLEFTENITGSADGYDYELWKDEGDTVFNVEPGGGCFSCEWKNIN
ncbi:MAG TPA: 1,4-beta-xylanase, partial [Ruminococcus flavefaciens]|nr:1,4-beta-xylanase [Ruminococcus flavefaciens]